MLALPRRPLVLGLLTCGLLACGMLACGGAEQAADGPEWIPFNTPRDCANAEVACLGARCLAKVDNRCDTPITCDLHVFAMCQENTGHTGKSEARSRATVLGQSVGEVEANVTCEAGRLLLLKPEDLRCQ